MSLHAACPRSLLLAVLLAVAGLLPAGRACADEAWRQRIAGELAKVEKGLAALDGKTAAEGALAARVKQAHERLCALEQAATITPGAVSGKDDLGSLTQDIVALKGRVAAIEIDRAPPPAKPAPKPAKDGDAAPAKPKEAPKAKEPEKPVWPERLDWKATASLTYAETGEWFISESQRSGLGNDFLQDGYAGTISFSVRAGGLKREIRSATLRVAVSIGEPFTVQQGQYRVYEVDWSAQRTMWNDALRTWKDHDTITVRGPIRWIAKPTERTMKLTASAHVLSLVTKDGETITFDAQEYVK